MVRDRVAKPDEAQLDELAAALAPLVAQRWAAAPAFSLSMPAASVAAATPAAAAPAAAAPTAAAPAAAAANGNGAHASPPSASAAGEEGRDEARDAGFLKEVSAAPLRGVHYANGVDIGNPPCLYVVSAGLHLLISTPDTGRHDPRRAQRALCPSS